MSEEINDTPLFRPLEPDSDLEEQQPPIKKSRFFKDDDEEEEQEVPPIQVEIIEASPIVEDEEEEEEQMVIIQDPIEEEKVVEAPKEENEVITLSSDEEDEVINKPKVASSSTKSRVINKTTEWDERCFGDLVIEGFTLYRSSPLCSLKTGESITLARTKPDPPKPGSKSSNTKKEDTIVRFLNSNNQVVGRITEKSAHWISKLLDLDIVRFEGTCVDVERKFQSGSNVILSLSPIISRKAFEFEPILDPIIKSSNSKTIVDESKETLNEKILRERKISLNRLFDATNLQPITIGANKGSNTGSSGKTNKSKRNLAEKLDAKTALLKKKVGEDGEEEEEEGTEMNSNQLNLVYSKAIKNDANLPEMNPPSSFALELRGYQKQALKWMYSMESSTESGSNESIRESDSMSPLWEEYLFPQPPKKKSGFVPDESFYYNPYSGELSLNFPKASRSTQGGILADEQGLGKTIMIAALIHASLPENENFDQNIKPVASSSASTSKAQAAAEPPSSDIEMEEDSSDDEAFVPSLAKPAPTSTSNKVSAIKRAKQTKLNTTTDGKLSSVIKNGKSSNNIYDINGEIKPTCTLIVAPMTLISQWVLELERSSKNGMNVLMYYGTNRTSIQDEIDSGVQVVVTSYGTLCSDFKSSGGTASEDAKEKKKDDKGKSKSNTSGSSKSKAKKRTGLYSVNWFRVVLDEAHLIKSRNTRNAKACYALNSERRWCLSGTPIVNRLEDLYSLLKFLQVQPWGNFSFYKTFITQPFEKKDPKALEVIQLVLEDILLRREKSMKDKNGNSIVALPPKHMKVEYLTFSDEERIIYDALYKNAKSQFLGYAAAGSVLKNVTAIFSILMRLRQAVLHPALVLGRLSSNLAAKKKLKRSIEEKAEDDNEEIVKQLLIDYNNSGKNTDGNSTAKIEELLDGLNDDEKGDCMICLEPAELPITLAKCLHIACGDCMTTHLGTCEENNQEPRCPTCDIGPIKTSDILEGIHLVKPSSSSNSKSKKGYTTSTSSPSSSGNEVLTILDSSDEDELEKKEKETRKSSRDKGKGKGKEKEIVEVEDESDEEDYVPKLSDFKMKNSNDNEDDDDYDDGSPTPGNNKRKNGMSFKKDDFKSSTKLDALKSNLLAVKEKEPLVKAIVFSQFTGFLDIIERMMNREGFAYVRLDGAMSQRNREKAVAHFTKVKTSCILLASLKAGGVGLNLIAATRIYLMDCWWNAAIESQACDRAHRFGQTKEVYIIKFLVSPSIDDKMISIQERKTRMINGALGTTGGEGKGKNSKQLAEDLALIFAD